MIATPPLQLPRAVFDCNIYFQALLNNNGPAGRCVDAVMRGKLLLFCTRRILDEFKDVASRPTLRAKFAALTDERVDIVLLNIERLAVFVDQVPEVFTLERDPDDAHYINVAIAVNAHYVVSRDKDLLDLRSERTPQGSLFKARFPTIEILEPTELLARLEPPKDSIELR